MAEDIVGRMMDFENGEMTNGDALKLFSDLVKNGMAWQMQGAYGRTASHLINTGILTEEGDITEEGQAVIDDEEAGIADAG